MLIGDRAKYIGIIIGLTFASLLITQQSAIFAGIMTRTFSFLTDVGLPDIWVVDPQVQYIDDIKPMRDTEVQRVRGVEGVQWAVPLYKGSLQARMDNGTFQSCVVIGLDDETLIGGPPTMLQGSLSDLRRTDGIIVDIIGAEGKLAKRQPDGTRIPLKVGDTMELNDNRACVVGICKLSFVTAKVKAGEDPNVVCDRIHRTTGLMAYTPTEFKKLTFIYYLKYTGMPINFLTAVALGFIVGITISGQTFYNFTLDNLRYFGTLKAMGTTNRTLLTMILFQATIVGGIGYGLGVGLASAWGALLVGRTQIAFQLPWQLLVITAGAVMFICLSAAALSIRKVTKLEPAVVFRS